MISLEGKFPFHVFFCSSLFLVISNWSHANEIQPVRGVVKSGKEAVLSVEFNARVIDIPVRTGESFKENDILMQFDWDALRAEKKAAQAAFTVAETLHNNNLELQQHGAIGDIEVGVSESQMHEAHANSEVIEARSKDCIIKAPYNGRVADLAINNFETTSVNQPLLKIVGSDDLELRLIVPSNWLSWLRLGDSFSFNVDETGNTHAATVIRIGAEVDAVSRTVPIIARFVQQPDTVLPGMSGTARFVQESS